MFKLIDDSVVGIFLNIDRIYFTWSYSRARENKWVVINN